MKISGLFLLMAAVTAPVLAADNAGNNSMSADEMSALSQQAREQVKGFGADLKQAVKQGMEAGGPVAAIQSCNLQAPVIADQHSQSEWKVGRTSLKLRNPDNAADVWETSVLHSFEQRLAAGEEIGGLEASTVENGQFRYMKAIGTESLCLGCHGDNLSAPVAARLAELYPADKATGYQAGQLRGAFTLVRTTGE
jgi:hypothetical protein